MQPTDMAQPGVAGLRAFLLYSNVVVGGIAGAVVGGTYALLGLPPSPALLVLACCGTFLVYQVERVWWPAPEDAFNQPERLAWAARHRGCAGALGAGAVLLALVTLPFLKPATLGLGLALAGLSLAYRLPLFAARRGLKGVWYAKSAAISLAWAVGGVVLPVLEAGASVGAAVVLLAVYRFLFIWPNTLLADWPDRAGDARAGVQTVAGRLTAGQLRGLGAGALVLALAGGLTAWRVLGAPWVLGVDLVGVLLMLVVVLRPWPRSRWFFGFVLDVMVAWPGVTALVAAFVAG